MTERIAEAGGTCLHAILGWVLDVMGGQVLLFFINSVHMPKMWRFRAPSFYRGYILQLHSFFNCTGLQCKCRTSGVKAFICLGIETRVDFHHMWLVRCQIQKPFGVASRRCILQ